LSDKELMSRSRKIGWVDAQELSLEDWLAYLRLPEERRPEAFEGYRFPTAQHRDAFIAGIHDRPDSDIRLLLRDFLLVGGSLGIDEGRLSDFTRNVSTKEEFEKLFEENEYFRRLMNRKRHTWEGMTWIIDLIPDFPTAAIQAIRAYDLAHYFLLPDGRCDGLADAVDIIRAKYLEVITPENLADTIAPRDFEFLVAAFYIASKYDVRVTPQTRDGGCDIVATKESRASTERLLVECKCGRSVIGVKVARDFLGALYLPHATRGVLVTTSRFSPAAVEFAKGTARIDLVDHTELCRRFNDTFGPRWPARISGIIVSAQAKLGKKQAP
jgi:restriction system protein